MVEKNSYSIYDVDGLVGEFITITRLKLFKQFLIKEGYACATEFIVLGSALTSEALLEEIEEMESFDRDIQDIIIRLRELFAKANTIMIINNEGE